MTQSPSLVVAQLTDLHLFAEMQQCLLGLPTLESLQAVMAQLAQLDYPPDLLLLTGDLSQDGSASAYQLLKNCLAPLNIPAYWAVGNHDCLAHMELELNEGLFHADKSFEQGGWHFILLNTQVPGCVHGSLSNASLEWLDCELARIGDRPTLIGLHHPPFRVGSDWLDGSTLNNPEALFAVIDRHPQVRLGLFGHIHQDYHRQRNGVQYFGTPSTCIQFEPHSQEFALDQAQPGFRLLHLYPDGTWWTQVVRSAYIPKLDLAAIGY